MSERKKNASRRGSRELNLGAIKNGGHVSPLSISVAGCKFTGNGSLSSRKDLVKRGLNGAMSTNFTDRVLKDVPEPESRVLDSTAIFDPDTAKPILSLLRVHFQKQGRLTSDAAIELISMAKPLLRKESNLLRLSAPIIICGDIHGQFYDLLNIFSQGGSPEEKKYLFLGDYVDRGDFSTEVMLYLIAMKINYPDQIFLLRGNHETRLMCEYMTFLNECLHKYDKDVFDVFSQFFDTLPLAATISRPDVKDIFCTHGGISPDLHTLHDIEEINRFQEPPTLGLYCDLLWSDPLDEFGEDEDEEELFDGLTPEQWSEITFIDNDIRHTSCYFGKRAISDFLEDNDLELLIRGHQVQDDGCMYHYFMEDDRDTPYCITVFSAPNYCDSYNNRAAFLEVTQTAIKVRQFSNVPHPYYLPDFENCFTNSLPTILDNVVGLLQYLVIKTNSDEPFDSPEEQQMDEELKQKIDEVFQESEELREKRSQFTKIQLKDYHENMPLFLRALKSDREQEGLPLPFRRKLMLDEARNNQLPGGTSSGKKVISSSSML